MTNKEAMQMALDALEFDGFSPRDAHHRRLVMGATEALRARLAQGEPEPVADGIQVIEHVRNVQYKIKSRYHLENGTELYTAPPQREWQWLTDDDIAASMTGDPIGGTALMSMMRDEVMLTQVRQAVQAIARAIEAKLKEKNT